MLKIGLTGGIGSGKSKVADWLAQWGATVIDTDVLAHQLTAPAGAALSQIVQQFGPQMLDSQGALDRAQMRAHVFANPQARRQLEAILHPLIQAEALAQIKAAQGCYVVAVIPLLVESGHWNHYFDQICVVDCDEPTQIKRVQARSGLAVEQIKQIMKAQATRAQRLAAADVVITNDGQTNLDQLKQQVLQAHQQWCAGRHYARAASSPSSGCR